ncbi:2180_t:CDS:1, partial [Funneliformis geosporum]
ISPKQKTMTVPKEIIKKKYQTRSSINEIVDADIAQNKAINNLDIPTNITMKNPRNNSQNKNQKKIIKKTKDLNPTLQLKKIQDRQIIIDSNSDESESDSS